MTPDQKLHVTLGEIQKTLLYPLWGRAREYAAPNALVRDTYAFEIVQKLDFDFTTIHRLPVHLQINSAVRAYQFDLILRKMIQQYPDATIVNIGAGLDTTFQRVDNGGIFWYDLDLEDTIQLRKQLIPEGERNKCIAKSMFDRSWFHDITVKGSKVFFIAAGVFAYFKEEEIKALLLDMQQEFPDSEILFEIYAKMLVWMADFLAKRNKRPGAFTQRIQRGVNSVKAISKWSEKISIVEVRPFYAGIDLEQHWDRKYLLPVKMLRLLHAIKLIHLKFR